MDKPSQIELECLEEIENPNVREVAIRAREQDKEGYVAQATYTEAYSGERA